MKDKRIRKLPNWIKITISLLSIITVYLLIVHIINASAFRSKIFIDGWGSFLGGIIAGASTLIAFIVTIIINKKKFDKLSLRNEKLDERQKEIQKLNYKPFIDINIGLEKDIGFKQVLGSLLYSSKDINKNNDSDIITSVMNLLIDNNGLGTAYDVKMTLLYNSNKTGKVYDENILLSESIMNGRGIIYPINFYNLESKEIVTINIQCKNIENENIQKASLLVMYYPEKCIWVLVPPPTRI